MKTKAVKFYIDLYPGWQDNLNPPFAMYNTPNTAMQEKDWKRVEVVIELPAFGGSADTTETARGIITEVTDHQPCYRDVRHEPKP